MKFVLPFVLLGVAAFGLDSCQTEYNCDCSSATAAKTYDFGLKGGYEKASQQCVAIQQNENWDTCAMRVYK